MDLSDWNLLEEYAHKGSEEAFAKLLHKHVNLVYSAALRQVNSREYAEDIVQSVFIDLARSARALKKETVLSAWLYQVTRRTAVDFIRKEIRRRNREQTSFQMTELENSPSQWPQIAPVLDEAMETLSEADRTLILLRYFENKSFQEVGRALAISESAAQRRISRAIEHLRNFFSNRGIPVSGVVLSSLLSSKAVEVAPATLLASFSSDVTIAGATAWQPIAGKFTHSILMTTAQKTLLITSLALASAFGVYEAYQNSVINKQLFLARQETKALKKQFLLDRQKLDGQLASLETENALLKKEASALARLRSEVTRLAEAERELASFKSMLGTGSTTDTEVKSWILRRAKLKNALEKRPELNIPELAFCDERDWLGVAKDVNTGSEDSIRRSLRDLREIGKKRFAHMLQNAMHKYVMSNEGKLPANVSELGDYFAPSMNLDILQRYEMLSRGNISDVRLGDWLAGEKSPVDNDFDTILQVGIHDYRSRGIGPEAEFNDALKDAIQSYAKANQGRAPGQPSELLSYFSPSVDRDLLKKFLSHAEPGSNKTVNH